MIVYVDVLFIMHLFIILFINFLSLKFVNMKNKNKYYKIFLVSLISSIFSCIIYIYNIKTGKNVTIYYVFLELLNVIALIDTKNIKYVLMLKDFFKLLVSQLIIMLVTFSVILVIIEAEYTYTFKVLVCSFFLTHFLVVLMYKIVFDLKVAENFKYEVEMIFEVENENEVMNDKKIYLEGYLDSGNLATYLGKPVSFLKESIYKNKVNIKNEKIKIDEYIEMKTAIGIERMKLIRPLKMIIKNKKDNNNFNNDLNEKVLERPYVSLIKDENLRSDLDVILNKNIFI